ncbi:MAG: AAA family ATPase [Pirellulaceae bacterium]|nr:AAA family ATPase [Pirellulaceae bacterium]
MSLSFFNLNARPFPTIPVAELCCYYPSFAENLTAVENALCQQQGPALILGGAGVGKTMLLRALEQRRPKAEGICVSLDAAFGNRQEFFQTLLFELGLESLATTGSDPRLMLTSALRFRPEFAAGIWLFVDEAHSLNEDLFEQLRLLSNLVRDGRPVFQMAFAGSRQLEELLLNPSLESLQQRLACRAYLTGMSLDELRGYIDFQWRRAGGQQSPLTSEAVEAVHTATMGIPRLVNQLCDQAIHYAASKQVRCIDEHVIQIAWALWQRLPVPQLADRPAAEAATTASVPHAVVEFGSLDDEPNAALSRAVEPASPTTVAPTKLGSWESTLVAMPATTTATPLPILPQPLESRTAAIERMPLAVKDGPETLIRFAFESDIQKPLPVRDAGPEPSPSSITTGAEARKLDVKIDTIQQALASLQERWEPIDELLIEADLQAVISPIEVVDPSGKAYPQIVSNDPSIAFQDHLYLESLWIEDTVWTQYIRTPDSLDEVSPVSLPLPGVENHLPAPNIVPASTEPAVASAAATREIRIDENPHLKVNPPQSLSRWESVRAIDSPTVDWNNAEPALSPEVRTSEGSFRDDANIIHRQPVVAAGETSREHTAEPVPAPVLARRKDLRALLHALRGY